MKSEPLASDIFSHTFTPRHSSKNVQRDLNPTTDLSKHANFESWQRQSSVNRRRRDSLALSDKESVCSISTTRSKKFKTRINSMKPLKGGGINKKTKTMDYTNYAYNEAVGRLKLMLASESYSPSKTASSSYLRNINDDSADNYSDNMSTIDRPVYADISKYLSPSQKNRLGATITTASYRPKKTLSGFSSASKENLAMPSSLYQPATQPITTALANPSTATIDYYSSVGASKPLHTTPPTDSVQAPVEIFNFIEKQEDYIEQLEKESKYCRNELTNLLGKVKDVINENEQLTDIARSELGNLGKGNGDKSTTSPSSDSDDVYGKSKAVANRNKKEVKSPRYAAAPNIVYEARISELEADLMQAQIDLKRVKTENEDLKKKLARSDPLAVVSVSNAGQNCEIHRKQIEMLQKDKSSLEENIRHLQKSLDEAKSQQYSQNSQKRYINDLVQMERSQAEMEVRHLRDELDRQHERVRELQMEMARRVAEERSNAERRYNNQVDQLGGDLSSQWEQVAKLQLDLERQKRIEGDMKRDLANRNSQIEELKMELRSNRSTFLADMAQVNAEKQSLEQEITALRLQLDRALRENKTEAARLNAEINSLRQRLDRADADLLHSKREVLRLNDEIASLEKELAYGEMKNEIRPTKKDLDKRISEMQEKHAETVNELEEMIQSQKQLMDKLTGECKALTNKLEDTTLKHKLEFGDKQPASPCRSSTKRILKRRNEGNLRQCWTNDCGNRGGEARGNAKTIGEANIGGTGKGGKRKRVHFSL
ncbi:serologically defined colon cancer antigen 8 homolog isoform X4 [Musca domestica]|uniref:Serologically defined colon cancer antigen 8 homolog isoform X4 n=1 Tax=Musca domestica TaxID=7370 RepID=A0ABM3V0I4_MUSDO|nr:serologically defined colon cancer antigen 8 homolog isoform X4 [Musca domestica]